jgi:filamentous hemagglutinin
MAVTRINNNQITTAQEGNVYLGINAASKLQNYSITSNKIANSLVYGSDLTVSGNLIVNGTTTTIDTVNTLIQDPLITLADGQTAGTPTVDIGLIGLRGNQNSSFIGWKESQTEFVAALSNTTVSNTTANITSYANFHANSIIADGNLSVAGNILGNINFSGNITAGNLISNGIVSAVSNITGGNVLTGGLVSATANITGGNLLTGGLVSATANITGGNLLTGGLVSSTGNVDGGNINTAGLISATGNVTGGNINFGSGIVSGTGNIYANTIFANISGNIDAAGSNTEIQFNGPGDILAANANFTYNYATNLMTVNGGNINTGNLSATGQVVVTANITGGNILTGGIVSATGNATAGNVLTGGIVSATGNITTADTVNTANISLSGNVISALNVNGNITGGNVLTPGLVSATGNATAGNVLTSGIVSATANITGGNVLTGGLISAGGNITSATNVNTPNVVGASGLTLSTGGNANINLEPAGSGNIVINNRYINGLQLTPLQDADAASKYYVDTIATTGLTVHEAVFATTNTTLATATGGNISYTQPNGAANGIGALISTTGTFTTIDTANVQTPGTRILVKNEANAVLNGVYTYTNATSITRSTDTDQYGSQSTESFSINDYFFTTNGNVNSGAAFVVDAPAGVITFGTSNITFAQFSSSQTYTANVSAGLVLVNQQFNAKVDNNTTAFDGTGNISVKVSANLTTPNIGAATGTSLSVTGAVTAGTDLSAVANVIAGNVTTVGLISATGNVTGGNINTAGLASVTGNITGGNINVGGGAVSTTGNVYAGNVINTGISSVTGNIIGGNILTGGLISATGGITSAATIQGLTVSATGNIIGGNVTTVGLISATGNVTGGNVLTGGLISAAGNIDGANINGTIYGNINSTTISASGNITGGNLLTGGLVSATGTITSANVITGLTLSATGNVIGGNVTTAGLVSATGNVIGGNVTTAGLVSATGNITGGNITGVTAGQFGNIVISGDDITDTNGRVNFNTAGADVDFAVNGDTLANVFYVDAGTGTASFGSSLQQASSIVAFNSTDSILLPTGNTGVRPSGVTGQFRFNTTLNSLEIYNNSEWQPVGSTTFTVIADEQFNGDGANVAFTLGSTQTTNSCIVSINGIVQIPGTAYSVSGIDPTCVLTFTEAPAIGDLIDVREITTTTTVVSISNSSGNSVLAGSATRAEMTLTGNLIPIGANATQTLGNATNAWSSLYVAGNTIYLGNIQLQEGAGNTFSIFQADGTTPAQISGNNVNTTSIANGTSNVTCLTSGGNILVGVGGANIVRFTGFGIENAGSNATGNIGNSSSYFNTVFAKATSAQYADLAEKYVADAEYAPGTVLSFGGEKEVTQSTVDADRAVAGVVSTNPSYIMNATLEAEHVATIALTGRVPTSVTGAVVKGDLMVSNGDGTARAETDPKAGAIIGKALENFAGDAGVIEVVIGRF